VLRKGRAFPHWAAAKPRVAKVIAAGMIDSKLFRLSSEVQSALAANKPLVALESTVIAHGLPRPQNLETAIRLEQIVREAGSLPATIAILDGQFCVGLSDEEVRFIAEDEEIRKVSIRDLPIAIAQQWNGATTVASTSWIAHPAGIKVFATGGIGGVHRGSLSDISADLPALANTSLVVVCSGAKIVLDLPATREWLETYGITVVGYQCDEMPAFYSRCSSLPVDVRVDSPQEVAQLFLAQQALGVELALLVTVPVPQEFEVPTESLEGALRAALQQAESQPVVGRELTPFLLSRMAQISEGATLKANIALLENNALIAAAIAVTLAD
jgi:pseudouridine-5'-phosphate glycosidase